MKKAFLKITSVVLSVIIFATSFTACAPGMIEADASQYLTKGEWFAYFASETDLKFSGANNELNIENDSQYYEAVMSIVDNEILDAETACQNLDKKVTKDIVANTCVNYLPEAYRKASKRTFTDANKITDIKAAAEAVDYGFVEPKSKKKFGPEEYLDIDACESAINATVKRITTYEFPKEECNFVINYRENVFDTDAKVEVVEGSISNYYDYTEGSNSGELDKSNDFSVSLLGLRSSKPKVKQLAFNKEDSVTIRVPENVFNKNKEAYKVGNIVKVQPFELSANFENSIRTVECSFLKITMEPLKFGSVYSVTGVLPTVEETIKSVGKGQKSREEAKNGKITEDCKAKGVSGLKITSDGVSFKYTNSARKKIDIDNGRSNKTDPTLGADFSISVGISNITLQTDGFDSIFMDAIFSEPNANINLSYTTSVELEASFPETRLAPYNNGNGKFPSNLSRSRWTCGNGAKDIKIAVIKLEFGPIIGQFGLYLQIHLDGKITVTLKKDTHTTYHISRNGISTTSYSEKSISARAEINLYVGVELRGDIHIFGLGALPLCDAKVGVGFVLNGSGNLFMLTEENKYTDKRNTDLSGEELQAIVSGDKKTKFGYCLNIKLSFKIYADAATGDCIVGKVIRLFKNDFSAYHEWNFPIFEKHWEDGHEVDKCTREPADKDKEQEEKNLKCGDRIDISNYNLVLDEGTCDVFYVTQIPCKEKNKEKTAKRITVASTDNSVCTATYYKEDHMIQVSAVGEGTCEIRIAAMKMTSAVPLGMDYVSCAIIVNKNKQVSFVPQDSNYRIIHL